MNHFIYEPQPYHRLVIYNKNKGYQRKRILCLLHYLSSNFSHAPGFTGKQTTSLKIKSLLSSNFPMPRGLQENNISKDQVPIYGEFRISGKNPLSPVYSRKNVKKHKHSTKWLLNIFLKLSIYSVKNFTYMEGGRRILCDLFICFYASSFLF